MVELSKVEFDLGMNRLKAMFGEEVMQPMRLAIIAKRMKHLTARQWDHVVDELVGSCRQTPVLRDFLKLAEPMLADNAETRRLEEESLLAGRRARGEVCPVCDDVGLVSAWSRKHPGASTYAFRCTVNCLAAQLKAKNAPELTAELRMDFVMIPLHRAPMQVFEETFGPIERKAGLHSPAGNVKNLVDQVIGNLNSPKEGSNDESSSN